MAKEKYRGLVNGLYETGRGRREREEALGRRNGGERKGRGAV